MKRKPSPEFLLVLALVVGVGYLGLWPVPITAFPWNAPEDRGLVAPFAANDILADMALLGTGDFSGPEDIAIGPDKKIYASTASGSIIRLDKDGQSLEQFATAGGRPLGIEFDAVGNLLVANAELGLQRISPDGRVDVLFDEFGGEPIVYANDLAIADDGRVFLSESSSKFGAAAWGGTYAASLLDLLEHGTYGRVYVFDPRTGTGQLLLMGLSFANGIAISEDQQYLLLAETGAYRIWRYWLGGDKAGQAEAIVENLPAFPDNINRGADGRFWVGLVAPRNSLLDRLADKPFLREVVQRLPAALRPAAQPSTHLIAIDGNGRVLMNLQDSAAGFPALTGAAEDEDVLYLSSLFGSGIGTLKRSEWPAD